MGYETPMNRLKGNLLFTNNGQCWAYYLVEPHYIHEGDIEKLEDHRKNLEQYFLKTGLFVDIHLQMYPKELRIEERFEKLEKDFDPNLLPVSKTYMRRTKEVIKDELGRITENAFVVGVRLSNLQLTSETGIKEISRNAVTNTTGQVLNWLGFEKPMSSEELASYEESEKKAALYVAGIRGGRLTEDELYYMARYPFIRGLSHTYQGELEHRRNGGAVNDPMIDPATHPGYLHIIYDYGESFVAMLPVSKTPEDMEDLGLFWEAQKFPYTVEVGMKLKKRTKASTLRKIGSTLRTFKETDKELYHNNDSDDDLVDGVETLNELRNDVTNRSTPVFDWMSCFIVIAETKEACYEQIQEVKETMAALQVTLVHPQADQLALFYKFLPGQALHTHEPNWLQWSTHEGLSELQFGVSQRLGMNVGFYIGRSLLEESETLMEGIQNSRFISLVHPFLVNEGIEGTSTDSPHIAITGPTGSGKSFLAKLMSNYQLFLDGQILETDPKSEMKFWYDAAKENPDIQENYPEFIELLDQITYVTLDADDRENWGVLDPLTFLEGARARDSILTIFEYVFPEMSLKVENEVRRELDRLFVRKASGEAVGLMLLVRYLQEHSDSDIQEIGENMFLRIKDSVLQLAFSDGTNQRLKITNKFTVLQIKGLDLPEADTKPEEWTDQDKKNLALMIALSNFCQAFGMESKKKKTTIIFEEAWTLTAGHGGKRLTKQLRRIGRSWNNQLIMVTQSVSDAQNEEESGNFGLCFAFDNPDERGAILEHMELEDNDYNRALLAGLKKGQCLFKDPYGRKGPISVDCVFPEWTEAFKTVDQSHAAKAESTF